MGVNFFLFRKNVEFTFGPKANNFIINTYTGMASMNTPKALFLRFLYPLAGFEPYKKYTFMLLVCPKTANENATSTQINNILIMLITKTLGV